MEKPQNQVRFPMKLLKRTQKGEGVQKNANLLRPLPNILKIVFLQVVAAFEMLDSLGFMAPLPNIRSQDFV